MKKIKKYNIIFFSCLTIILLISFVGLSNFDNHYLIKQFIWIVSGFIFFVIIKNINIRVIIKFSFLLYLFNLALLLLVLFIGKEINGSKAWFTFGFFSFQPSELMKISLSLIHYKLLNDNENSNTKLLIKIIILFILPSILVFLEPDTGAIIIYFIIMLVALFSGNIKKIYLVLITILLILCIAFFIGLYFFNPNILIKYLGTSILYRIDRIIHFKNNYQLNQALIYIGAAGLWGHKNILYVPEAHTDFIFAFLIGRYGFILGIIIILCYLFMNLSIINISKNNQLAKFFMYIFFYGEIQNILMNIGLFPIMGIPLPFLSYGGTNTIILFIFLGLISNKYKI